MSHEIDVHPKLLHGLTQSPKESKKLQFGNNKFYNDNRTFIVIKGQINVLNYNNNTIILKGLKYNSSVIANIDIPSNGNFYYQIRIINIEKYNSDAYIGWITDGKDSQLWVYIILYIYIII